MLGTNSCTANVSPLLLCAGGGSSQCHSRRYPKLHREADEGSTQPRACKDITHLQERVSVTNTCGSGMCITKAAVHHSRSSMSFDGVFASDFSGANANLVCWQCRGHLGRLPLSLWLLQASCCWHQCQQCCAGCGANVDTHRLTMGQAPANCGIDTGFCCCFSCGCCRLKVAGTIASSAAYVTAKLAEAVGHASYVTALAIAKSLPGHKKRHQGKNQAAGACHMDPFQEAEPLRELSTTQSLMAVESLCGVAAGVRWGINKLQCILGLRSPQVTRNACSNLQYNLRWYHQE
jgi:hypothetical protein